jgi:hypothetical protein
MTMGRASPEHDLQRAVAQYLAVALRPPVFWTSIDHGAAAIGRAAAGVRKARGVKSGLPDVWLFVPADFSRRAIMSTKHPGHLKNPLEFGPLEPRASHVIAIELKVGRGRLSDDQVRVHADLQLAGVACRVARSVDDVQRILELEGVPLRARVAARAAA